MKKLTKLFAAAVSLLALSFAGCSNLVDDATIAGDTITLGNAKILTIEAKGDESSVVFPDASARTILPGALDGQNLTFYLWGTDKLTGSAGIEAPSEVKFYAKAGTNGRTGSVELDLPTSQYELVLAATEAAVDFSTATTASDKQNKVKAAAVLYATATVDMRYSEKAQFYLTPYSASMSGKGNVKLTVYTNWAIPSEYLAGSKIQFGMYDLVTDAPIAATSPTSSQVDLTAADSAKINNPDGTTGHEIPTDNYSVTGVAAGTYNFKVKFVGTSKTYVWSDTIVVLPNRDTTATIIVPNVIGVAPAAPTDFTARFVEPENTVTDQYDVQFLWTDNANNEQYFKLELLSVDSQDTFTPVDVTEADFNAQSEAVWTALTGNSGHSKAEPLTNSVYADPRYVAGSLNANNGMLTIKLRLGTRYLARICAVNDAGESDSTTAADTGKYTYVNLSTTGTETKYTRPYQTTEIPATDIKKFADDQASPTAYSPCINRFRVTYNFTEGRYYEATYDSTTKKITDVGAAAGRENVKTLNGDLNADVRYYSQLTAGNVILNPLKVKDEAPSSSKFFALYKGSSEFTGWKLNSTAGDTLWRIDASSTTAPAEQAELTGIGGTPGTGEPNYTAYYVNSTHATPASRDFKYPGYGNLNLFAVFGTAVVNIYNPADYQILDGDVCVKAGVYNKGIADTDTAAVTVDAAKSFEIDLKDSAKQGTVYIAIRNFNYSKVAIKVASPAGDTKLETTGGDPLPDGTTITQDRYVVATHFETGVTLYKLASGTYTADSSITDQTTFAAATVPLYYKDTAANHGLTADQYNNFVYFKLPTKTEYAPGISYQITLMGYTDKNPMTPFKYVLTMKVKETN